MFTGIVKEVGKVDKVIGDSAYIKLGIKSFDIFNDAEVSDSIAINGVCLTLIYKEKDVMFFEAIASTLKDTNIKRLKKGNLVNLESALTLNDKIGGHFVLGHVDAELKVKKILTKKNFWELEVDLPSKFRKYVLNNGSITIEGLSLTIKKILSRSLTVNIVPYTYKNTTLSYKRIGDWLNIEFDYLLKHNAENKK